MRGGVRQSRELGSFGSYGSRGVLKLGEFWGDGSLCMYKMPFFDYEMCTLQKVCGEDISKGRRVL